MPPPPLAPQPAKAEARKPPEIAAGAPASAEERIAASQPPPLPPAPPAVAATELLDEAGGESGSETALPPRTGASTRNGADGWLPPPLPVQSARSARLPPPIPPLPGPKPMEPWAQPPEAEPSDAARPSTSAPWAEAAVPVPAPAPLAQTRPFDSQALIDAIPERMRVAVPETIEIEIPRSQILSLGPPMLSPPLGLATDADMRKAISVRLRSKTGGMTVEAMSPETQWIDRRADSLSDETVRWRWVVTPRRRGTDHLAVSVGCRTISTEGLTAEATLPEQSADVVVRADRRKALRQTGGWLAAMCLGALLMKLADGVVSAGVIALARLTGG